MSTKPEIAKRILYIVHSFHNRGGTEEHTKLLARELGNGFDCAILYPENSSLQLYLTGNGQTQSFEAESTTFPVTNYSSTKVDTALIRAIDSFAPDLIHVQHFFNWPLSVLDIVLQLGVPTVLSFHDYYAITPYFTMQGARSVEEALSPEYVTAIFGKDISHSLRERKAYLQKRIELFQNIVVPSKYLAGVMREAFGVSPRVIEHGIAQFTKPTIPYRGDDFRFGCIGSLLPQKGWHVLVDAFQEIRESYPNCELHLFGGGERSPSYPPAGVFFHGVYEQEQISEICSQFHVGVIPSVFAETYCLVLSELQQAGRPVAASRIGALAERVVPGKTGVLFEPGDRRSIVDALRYFLEDDRWREWVIPAPRLAPAMAADYSALYNEVTAKSRS